MYIWSNSNTPKKVFVNIAPLPLGQGHHHITVTFDPCGFTIYNVPVLTVQLCFADPL